MYKSLKLSKVYPVIFIPCNHGLLEDQNLSLNVSNFDVTFIIIIIIIIIIIY